MTDSGKTPDGQKRARIIKLVCLIAAIAFALGAAACGVCIYLLNNTVLYIPLAVLAVGAIILFTYWKNAGFDGDA